MLPPPDPRQPSGLIEHVLALAELLIQECCLQRGPGLPGDGLEQLDITGGVGLKAVALNGHDPDQATELRNQVAYAGVNR